MRRTIVIFLLDKSGSMTQRNLCRGAMQLYNDTLADLKKGVGPDHQILVGRVDFAGIPDVVQHPVEVQNARPESYYYGSGGTALYDAVYRAADLINGLTPYTDDAYLILAITDGEDTSSLRGPARLAELIRDRQGRGNYTFAFAVPRGDYRRRLESLGVPGGNIREWETTEAGMEETQEETRSSFGSYLQARSVGHTAVRNFYDVTTDLSALTKTDLTKLTDLRRQFKAFAVDKEVPVREFVAVKTGKPYVIGSTFYALTKREKVQPGKKVLVVEKGKAAVYGGDEARKLIGLPTDGVSDAKVTPGNHANFDIYVQTTSVNRKLVRGTKVFVDTTKTRDDTPTWDHTLGGTLPG